MFLSIGPRSIELVSQTKQDNVIFRTYRVKLFMHNRTDINYGRKMPKLLWGGPQKKLKCYLTFSQSFAVMAAGAAKNIEIILD